MKKYLSIAIPVLLLFCSCLMRSGYEDPASQYSSLPFSYGQRSPAFQQNQVKLVLDWNAEKSSLTFKFSSQNAVYSSGRVVLSA